MLLTTACLLRGIGYVTCLSEIIESDAILNDTCGNTKTAFFVWFLAIYFNKVRDVLN